MRTPVKQMLGKTGLLCGLAVFVAASAHASQVINFNGLYASNNLAYVLPTPVDSSGNTRTWIYSDTTPITPAANYTGPAVYGGFQTQSTNGVTENLLWLTGLVKDGYSTTNTKLWAASTSQGSTLTAMYVFKPTVESGQTVSFDATSSINYFMTSGDQGARFVLNNGGNWFISSNALTLSVSANLTGSSLLNSTWAAFDPVGVAPLPAFPVAGYTSLGSSFNNIQGIGVYFSGNRPASSYAPYVSLGTFTVDAAGLAYTISSNSIVFSPSAGENVFYNWAVTGTNSLVLNGAGTVTLGGTNTFSGGTTVSGSTLVLGNASALGTGSVAVTSGGLNSGSYAITNALTNSGGTVSASGKLSAVTASGGTTSMGGASNAVVSISGAATVDVTGADTTVNTMSGGTLNVDASGLVLTNYNGGNIGISNSRTLTVQAGSSSGTISGAGALTKSGGGTLTLTATNTYTGATVVEAGQLVVNGSISSSSVTVAANSGTIGGSGSVGALTIANGGTLAPGNSPGTLFATSATWTNGGSYDWEIFNVTGTPGATNGWDLLDVAGTLTLTGLTNSGFTINLITLSDSTSPGPMAVFNSSTNYSWVIARATTISGFSASIFDLSTATFGNAFTGIFGIEQGLYEGDQALFLTYNGGGEAIPEPGTWAAAALLATAAGFVGWRRRVGRVIGHMNADDYLAAKLAEEGATHPPRGTLGKPAAATLSAGHRPMETNFVSR